MKNEKRKFVQKFIDSIVTNHFEGGADYSTSKELEHRLNNLIDHYYQTPDTQMQAELCTCEQGSNVPCESCIDILLKE